MANVIFRSLKINGRPAMVGHSALGVYRLTPNTFRLLYRDGVTPTFTNGTAVHISESPNIWDLTCTSTYAALQGHTDLLEVMDAGNMRGQSNFSMTFKGCTSLRYVCPFNATITKASNMFQNCSSLTSIPYLNLGSIGNGYSDYMFDGCSSLTSVPLLNTSTFTTANYVFRNCSSLTEVPSFNLSNVRTATSMFEGCTLLSNVPALNLRYASNGLGSMFKGCSSLTTIPSLTLPSSLRVCSSMFEGCVNVESGITSMYSTLYTALYNARSTYYGSCFKDCGSNTTTGAAELAQIPSSWK